MQRIYSAAVAPLASVTTEAADAMSKIQESASLLVQIVLALTALVALFRKPKK